MHRIACFGTIFRNLILSCVIVLMGCDSNLTPDQGMQRAEEYRKGGNYSAAILELKNVLQNSPEHRDTRLMLGELYVLQGDGASAETQLLKAQGMGEGSLDIRTPLGKALLLQKAHNRVIDEITAEETDPGAVKAELLALRGYAYFFKPDFEQAERIFREALSVDPEDPFTLVGLAMTELENGSYDQAGQHVEQVLASNAGSRDAWITKGRLALIQGQYDLAETAFRTAANNTNSSFSILQPIQTHVYLVQVLIEQGKTDDANRVVESLLQSSPKHPMPHYLSALIAYENGNFYTANEQIRMTRSIVPDYDPALMLDGAINYALGNLEQANSALTAYLTRHPDDNTARKLLAAAQLKLQQPEQALELVSPILREDPNDLELLALASNAMRLTGKPEASIPLIEKMLQQDPDNANLKMQLASAYLSDGEIDEAIRILEALPASREKFGRRELLLLFAWIRKEDNESALAFLDTYISAHPQDPDALANSGVLLMRMGRPDAARDRLEMSLSLKPDNDSVLMALVRVEFSVGNHMRAEQLLGKLLEMDPTNANILYALANTSASQGNRTDAIDWLERVRQASDTLVEPRLALVKYYLEDGNIAKAQEVIAECAEIAPSRADVWNTYSVVQNRAGDREGAIESLREAEKLKPDSEIILMNLARSQISIQDIPGARETLRKLSDLAPDNFQAASMLAIIEMKLGDSRRAFAIAEKQQAFAANLQNALALEGDLQMMAGKYREAVEAYQAASEISPVVAITAKQYTAAKRAELPEPEQILLEWIQQHPNDTTIRRLLAGEYAAKGDPAKAIRVYETLIKLEPDDPDLLNNLAWAYHLRKDSKSVQTAEKALSLNTSSAEIKDTLGWILVHQGDVERGLPLLREAMSQLPENKEVQYHYAFALVEAGKQIEARPILQKLVDSSSDFTSMADAKKLLQMLEP